MKTMIVFAILIGSVAVSCASGSHEGGHHMESKHWTAPEEAARQVNPVLSSSNSISEGMQLYAELCARCHGDQGLGDGPDGKVLSVKPTNLKAMAGRHPDGDFAWKIKNGRGEMPAWEAVLEDEDVWHIVNYIKSLND